MYLVLKDAKKTHLMAVWDKRSFLSFFVFFFSNFTLRHTKKRQKKTFCRFLSFFFVFFSFRTHLTPRFWSANVFFLLFSGKDIFLTFDLECLFYVEGLFFLKLFDFKKLRKEPFRWKKSGVRWVFLLFVGANLVLSSFFTYPKMTFFWRKAGLIPETKRQLYERVSVQPPLRYRGKI